MSRSLALIDYGSGNLRSAAKALERVAGESSTPVEVIVTDDAATVRRADAVVLPGVGAFGDCRAGLDAVPGMIDALRESVIEGGRPFLGICVGMQLMARRGIEHGEHPGLAWIHGTVAGLEPHDGALKVPHMGWNELCDVRGDHPVLAGLGGGAHVYFAHSYGFRRIESSEVLARADHGGCFPAVVGRDNLVGTQFHPEKSQDAGLRLLANFLAWRP